MEEMLRAFLRFLLNERGYSSNTIAAYKNDLEQFLSFVRQRDQVAEWGQVGRSHIEEYVRELREREYASSTVARKVASLKSFFHYLHQEHHIRFDPTAEMGSPRVAKRVPRCLDASQVELLLASAPNDGAPKSLRDRALITLLYATGLRASEMVALSVRDADLERGEVQCVNRDYQTRLLPLTAEARESLLVYLNHGRPHLVKDSGETALFLNHRGAQLTRQGLWMIIKARAKDAGLPADVTPHTLRHSFAVHELAQGSQMNKVQRLLGHASISTTHVYSRLAAEADQSE